MGTYVGGSYYATSLDGLGIWTTDHCSNNLATNYELPLNDWSGSEVRFKFTMAGKYGFSTTTGVGWFVDNVGYRQAHFPSTGSWTSEPIDMADIDSFNHGIIEIDGLIGSNSSLTGTIVDDNGDADDARTALVSPGRHEENHWVSEFTILHP